MPFSLKSFTGFVSLVFLVFLFVSAKANEKIPVRTFSKEKLESFRNDNNFDYGRDVKPPVNFPEALLRWFAEHFLEPMFKYSSVTLWTIIKYIFLIVITGMLINHIVKSNRTGLFEKEQASRNAIIMEGYEVIHGIDFDKMIEQSSENGQFRIAIRYLYLKCLSGLSDRKLIEWKPDKTNRDYLRELKSSAIYSLFSELTALFNYHWYGGSEIDQQSYLRIKRSFDQLQMHQELNK